MDEPASQRAPPEIWELIARFIPRYHLRTWLYVSAFHREIAVRLIFHTVDLYFGEDQDLNRGLDIFDRVKADPVFASRVKCLRLHWAYEENDMFDLMTSKYFHFPLHLMRLALTAWFSGMFRSALPAFNALREFEWIGYPELRAEMVQAVLETHPKLQSLGLIGWHFDAVGVVRSEILLIFCQLPDAYMRQSAFRGLRKFILRAEDDDGFADMGEVRTVLDQNQGTLRHLTLGAYLQRNHSWDHAFQSATIRNLTHLELVDTRISHVVLARIAHAHRLESLTLHGTFEEPCSASVVFGSDHVIDGVHTFLPHLEEFRFIMVGHDDDINLFQSVTQFLRQRPKLRRLDLGCCPWDLVHGVLSNLTDLRALRVRIANLNDTSLRALLDAIPKAMTALHLETSVSSKPIVCSSDIPSTHTKLTAPYSMNTLPHSLSSRPSPCCTSTVTGAVHNRTSSPTRSSKCRRSSGGPARGASPTRYPRSTSSAGTASITSSCATRARASRRRSS